MNKGNGNETLLTVSVGEGYKIFSVLNYCKANSINGKIINVKSKLQVLTNSPQGCELVARRGGGIGRPNAETEGYLSSANNQHKEKAQGGIYSPLLRAKETSFLGTAQQPCTSPASPHLCHNTPHCR